MVRIIITGTVGEGSPKSIYRTLIRSGVKEFLLQSCDQMLSEVVKEVVRTTSSSLSTIPEDAFITDVPVWVFGDVETSQPHQTRYFAQKEVNSLRLLV